MKQIVIILGLGTGFLIVMLAVQRWVISTEYAKGYSGSAFRRIEVGETTARVQRLLGAPLRTKVLFQEPGTTNVFTIWEYALPRKAKFYKVRSLIFSNDVVDLKIDTFALR